MNWIISANSKKYDHEKSFEENDGIIFWRQLKNKFQVNDIIYIYNAKPFQKIMYRCIVESINIPKEDVGDTKKYWGNIKAYHQNSQGPYFKIKLLEYLVSNNLHLNNLRKNGLNGNPQGRQMIKDFQLLKIIENNFQNISYSITSEDNDQDIYEGDSKIIKVNRYERSLIARAKCIEHHGINCSICKINFESIYGDIGKGFIHVHHLKPISEIGKEYKIDYKKDLIPVCANCHAMLHRKLNGKILKIEELKQILNKKNR